MAWRPNENLIDEKLDNTVPGKGTGWMCFFRRGRRPLRVAFDLTGDFHEDTRGKQIRLRNDAGPETALLLTVAKSCLAVCQIPAASVVEFLRFTFLYADVNAKEVHVCAADPPMNSAYRPISQSSADVLHECCSDQTPAIILNVESASAYYHARMSSLTTESLTIDVLEPIQGLHAGSHCCISFSYRGDSRAFVSKVLEYRPVSPSCPAELILEIPSLLLGREVRAAYRVPVAMNSGLSVRVYSPENSRVSHPKAIDVSVAGILIEFLLETDPDLPIGATIDIELQLGESVAQLLAEVRRRVGYQYGMSFPAILTRQGPHPPEALRLIVLALEQQWLQSKPWR